MAPVHGVHTPPVGVRQVRGPGLVDLRPQACERIHEPGHMPGAVQLPGVCTLTHLFDPAAPTGLRSEVLESGHQRQDLQDVGAWHRLPEPGSSLSSARIKRKTIRQRFSRISVSDRSHRARFRATQAITRRALGTARNVTLSCSPTYSPSTWSAMGWSDRRVKMGWSCRLTTFRPRGGSLPWLNIWRSAFNVPIVRIRRSAKMSRPVSKLAPGLGLTAGGPGRSRATCWK